MQILMKTFHQIMMIYLFWLFFYEIVIFYLTDI